jgi:hypothetical protein
MRKEEEKERSSDLIVIAPVPRWMTLGNNNFYALVPQGTNLDRLKGVKDFPLIFTMRKSYNDFGFDFEIHESVLSLTKNQQKNTVQEIGKLTKNSKLGFSLKIKTDNKENLPPILDLLSEIEFA